MARSRSRRFLITQVDEAGQRRVPDEVIVEEPLTVVVNGVVVTTTMRTPGNDFELAAGFCRSEGLLVDDAIKSIRYCGDGLAASEAGFNRVELHTERGSVPTAERLTSTTSSCGWCGSSQIEALVAGIGSLPPAAPIEAKVLADVVGAVRERQSLFAATGSAHAAARFGPDGTIGEVREDVGRHNAVDKLVGHAVLNDELPAHGDGLFVSGRASVEMLQKAWAAGFSTLLAVSAPTELAVEAARAAGIQLVGFVRDRAMNVYSPERLGGSGG